VGFWASADAADAATIAVARNGERPEDGILTNLKIILPLLLCIGIGTGWGLVNHYTTFGRHHYGRSARSVNDIAQMLGKCH
jgi:hypothetical protein